MKPLIQADVTIFDGTGPDGETFKKCRLTMNGQPANAVLLQFIDSEQRWVPIDRLTNAKVIENTDGSMTITGTSDELIDIVQVAPNNATVRWEVVTRGCKDCG